MQLDGATLQALARGDVTLADKTSPVPLPGFIVGPGWRGVWQMRCRQIAVDPSAAAWVTGVVWDEQNHLVVGRAGFHGPPDAVGMVEIGYAIDLAYRRRGYARAALEALLRRAAVEPQVHTVRVTIGPDNVASLAPVSQYDFIQVGEQWDDEDGLELVLERPAS